MRVPTLLVPQSGLAVKIPPADLPEFRIFAMLQRLRRPVINWLDAAFSNGDATLILNQIVQVHFVFVFLQLLTAARWPSAPRPSSAEPGDGRVLVGA